MADEREAHRPFVQIQLQNFSIAFPQFRIRPLDLLIKPGERIALLGANGAGKSTLLRALAGLLTGYEGAIWVGEAELRELLPHYRRGVGLLPEKVVGTPGLTVAERLDLLADFQPRWDFGYAKALLDKLGLAETAPIATLSKGMALKFSFVAAEAHRPPFLLLDEPTSGLDPIVRRTFLSILRECLDREPARTLVFSTHILEDVEAFANRVWVLNDGVLTADTSVLDLRDRVGSGSLSTLLCDEIDRPKPN